MIRAELREVITRLQTLDRLPSQLETTFDQMKSESEIIRQNMNVFQTGMLRCFQLNKFRIN